MSDSRLVCVSVSFVHSTRSIWIFWFKLKKKILLFYFNEIYLHIHTHTVTHRKLWAMFYSFIILYLRKNKQKTKFNFEIASLIPNLKSNTFCGLLEHFTWCFYMRKLIFDAVWTLVHIWLGATIKTNVHSERIWLSVRENERTCREKEYANCVCGA